MVSLSSTATSTNNASNNSNQINSKNVFKNGLSTNKATTRIASTQPVTNRLQNMHNKSFTYATIPVHKMNDSTNTNQRNNCRTPNKKAKKKCIASITLTIFLCSSLFNQTRVRFNHTKRVEELKKKNFAFEFTCTNSDDEPPLEDKLRKMIQERVNEDVTTNKEMHDIMLFPGNSSHPEKSYKLQCYNNFDKIKCLFRCPNKGKRMDVCVQGKDLTLTPKSIIHPSITQANFELPLDNPINSQNIESESASQLSSTTATVDISNIPNCDNNESDNKASSNTLADNAELSNMIEEIDNDDNNANSTNEDTLIHASALPTSSQTNTESNDAKADNNNASSKRSKRAINLPDYYHNSLHANDNILPVAAAALREINHLTSPPSSQLVNDLT